ncbi:ABC transporter permease [Arachidicoccus ginsenosidivorans]|jgi:putative ABC transport system permease protein|uniref:ABC transporter permease n=1 Tax=Arachidicoccus ginsenosidivorans TaxID=496057 RepID=A0A5B8VKT6_9BACT|nr:ABC transporter permease [Arachidicoccus ginsenosidivorans]QEC71949.1 ABC transporter permease [Arachidicoccus ginsenosidivorans]
MVLTDSIKLAFQTVKSNKLRTGITVTIIALGIMALIGIVTATTAIKEKMRSSFSSMGANGFTITFKDRGRFGNQVKAKSSDGKLHKKSNLDKPISLQEAELFKSIYKFPAKVSIALDAQGSAELHYQNVKTNPNVAVSGGDENYLTVNGFSVAFGRNLNIQDVQSGRNVCVLGSDVASKLFSGRAQAALDKTILVGSRPYRVIGVLAAKGSGSRGSQDNFILTSYNNIRRARLSTASSFSMGIASNNVALVNQAAEQAVADFRRVRKLLPNEADNFVINKSDELAEKLIGSLGSIEGGAVAIGFITLIGAAIGLTNIMLVAVSERTKEIGLVKAIGGKRKDIRRQFLFESTIISLLGAIIGIFLGIMVGNLFAIVMSTGFIVPWGWVLAGVIVCSAVGLLAGLYPALKAARLNPIDALRYE